MSELTWKPIAEIAADVKSGKVSALSQVEKSLKVIAENEKYQSLIAVTSERAIKRAKEIDRKILSGEKIGRLAGVPFVAKDNFLVFGADTTAASNILKGFDAPYQSSAINKLEAEGAICVAKANLDAFAHGSSTENSDFFTTKNPHDETRVPGGSSGGSAAAVALKIAPFATGSDTGGSIRQPASFCGVVGLKPTYGIVSRSGVVAMGSSLDCIGVFSNSADDAAEVLEVMSGYDGLDMTLIERDSVPYTNLEFEIKGMKIGLIKEFMDDRVDDKIKQTVNNAVEQLKKAGAIVEEVSLPSSELSLPAYYIICPAELSSNLSRHDGQRYGYSEKDVNDLADSYELSRDHGFGAEAKRRIMIGTYVLSSGYYDAYYKKAQIVRTKLVNEVNKIFETYDFLLSPTAPTKAFKIGEKVDDPISMYLSDLFTVTANLAGVPAISLPNGEVDGLPVGIQVIGPQRGDRQLLAFSKLFMELEK